MCRNITFLMVLVFAFGVLQAQDYSVNFLKGAKQFNSNIMEFNPTSQIKPNELFNNRYYRFVQFNNIPNTAQQSQLANLGIRLLEYIPNYVYVASIPKSIPVASLQNLNIRSIQPIDKTYKMGQRLEDKDYPDWAMEAGQVIVSVQYFQDINASDALVEMKKMGLHVEHAMHHAQIVTAHIAPNKIENLVQSPFIRYVDVMNEPGVKESEDGRHLHRANAIDGDYSGARNYDGTGMTFAINDDGAIGPHIDFKNRTNQQTAGGAGGTHGDMTTGIAGGAGNLDPLVRGMATGAWIHVRQYNAAMPGTIPLHQDSAVLIFSSSYSNGCNAGYTNTTVLMDQEIYNNPNLMQTFSAGNSNNNDCGYGAGNQWGNITGGHKIGKNVIATANLSETDAIIASSSRGPASDGRIKPDISAHGNSQLSTDPNNAYAPGGGTSAAAPGICGVMTQMHHAYNSINGTTAPSALLKAALLTTANDLGNDGPDFIYGWGKVNGLKAVQLLEDNRYFSASVSQGASNTHNITIPAGVQRAKITVYWADKEASTAAATALINDLDATVTDPGTTIHLPWLLDHTPNATALATPATKGADHLNNIEQIAIDNPTAGTFVLNVGGTTVPFGPQEYWVVYEFLYDDITVIHPMGGEGLIPGTTDRIHWDAYGATGSFLIEYTEDDGATWTTISAVAPGSSRMLNWTVPNTLTGQARVRITRGSASDESVANFSIVERPQNIRVNRVCPSINAIQIAWDPVPGATGYDVFVLGFQHMDSIGSTSALTFNIPVADINDPQWFSVRAVGPNGIRSLRQIAVEYAGTVGGNPVCYLSCQGDNDAGIASLDAPGSILETCGGVTTTTVSMTVENIGLFTESNFPVYYQLGTNPVVQETFSSNLASGSSASYAFTTAMTVPTAGVYMLKTWTGLTTDSTHCNDTIVQMITVLDPLTSFPYSEDFNGGIFPPPSSYIQNPDGDRTWEPTSTTGAAGGTTTAMYVNNFSYNGQGEEDIFSFVTLDLTGISTGSNTAFMTFDVAYRRYNANFSDDLRIDLSTDCGQTFSQVYLKGGTTLATGGDATGAWAPSAAGDWRNDTIDLSTYTGSNVTLRFVNINGFGNNLYVDNINVEVLVPLAPVADFTSDIIYTCDGTINFSDESGNAPTQWLWTFGDGGTSTTPSPAYTYPNSGTYNVTLQVTNAQGVDTETKSAYVVVEYPAILSTVDGSACPNTPIDLTANVSNGTLHWYDGASTLIHVGDTFTTPPLLATTNYQVQNVILTPTLSVGPVNGVSVGGGGNHNSGFYGIINFTAYSEFELLSVWVDAGSAGNRTIYLWDGNVANGAAAPTNTVLDQRIVNLANGGQRVQLNFSVPGPGNYSIGANNADLYRNNSGASYPYTLTNVLSMTSSAANNTSDFYYYFYDWQVRQDSCPGALLPITAEVVDASFTAASSGGTAAFTDASTGATSWLWNFGDGNTSTQQNPMHTFANNGPHIVTLTINNGACSFVDSVSVSVGIEQIAKGMNVVLMPNPATNETTLRFSEALPYDMEIQVIAVDGKILIQENVYAGESNKIIDVSALPPAVYLVRLRSNEVVDVRKLIIGE